MNISAFAGLAILCLNLSAQTASQEARIDGKMVNLVGSAPIEGVALALQPLSSMLRLEDIAKTLGY